MIDTIRRDSNAAPPQIDANPTYIPDHILDTLTPVFVIRHPISLVNSLYRVQLRVMGFLPTVEDFEVMGTLRWCQILCDYFISKGHSPAIVEAQDFIYQTKATTDKLCRMIGIDPEGVKDAWDPVPKEHWPDHKVGNVMTGHMMGSSGIERAKEVSDSRNPPSVSVFDLADLMYSQASGV